MTRLTPRGALMLALGIVLAEGHVAGAQVPRPQPPPPPPPVAPIAVPTMPAVHKVGPPGVAATVNGQQISKAQVSALAFQIAGSDLLEQIINNTLVDQAAKQARVTVTPAEITARYAQVQKQLADQQRAQGLPVQPIATLIQQNHQTLATFRDSLRLRIEAEKLVNGQIAPLKMVHARHILVVTNGSINPTLKAHSDADALKLITKAQDELKSGKTWDEVCKKYSEDPSNKDKGGELGIIGTGMGQIDPTFLAAAIALKPGQTTPTPIKSVYGYHLIKVDSTNTAPASSAEKAQYAAAIASTRDTQFKQIIPPYLARLRQTAKINNYLTP